MTKPSSFFNENITLLGGIKSLAANDPEKYNLYAGLENLSKLIERINQRVDDVESCTEDIQRRVKAIEGKK